MSKVSIIKRMPFTTQEDIDIIRFIIDGGHYQSVSGNTIWKKMVLEPRFKHRTFESLKNRFKKNILVDPRRPELGLDEEDIEVLKMCRPPQRKTQAYVKPPVKSKRPDDFTSQQLNMDFSSDESDVSGDNIEEATDIEEPQIVAKESPKKPTNTIIEYKYKKKRVEPVEVESDSTPDVSEEEEMNKPRLLWETKRQDEFWCDVDDESDQN